MSAVSPVVPTLDLVHRVNGVETAYTVSRMRVLESIPGNPIGIAFRKVDEAAIALMARHLPSPFFNSVVGLRVGHERHIQPLVEWYREHGVRARFVMEPGSYGPELGRELARLGYYQSEVHAALIGTPGPPTPVRDAITVEAVTDAAAMEDYLAAYASGWSIPEQDRQQFKANVRPWLGQPGWSLYLVRIDGQPAAAATLYRRGRGAYCADAATDPAFRGRGLQSALLQRRIGDAWEAGAEFVSSGASYLSASHRNMERAPGCGFCRFGRSGRC
jgi:GNAT superfamily N-acetyltransferase